MTLRTRIRENTAGLLVVPGLLYGAPAIATSEASLSLPPIGAPAPVPEILRQMVGCFQVTFSFVEDGVRDQFFAPVFEKAVLVREEPLTIDRFMIVDGAEQRHWSEVWTEVDGRTWRQHVVGPYGDFRYECEGTWDVNQWTCSAKGAAKPRRDAVEPYAVLDRVNTLQVNPKRWVQVENNRKIKTDGSLYSVEVGWNRYERVTPASCVATPQTH